MKKYVLWPLLAAIGGVGAFLLRLLQRSTGFEVDTGLPIPGNLYAILLVAWFVVLAAVCLLAARPLLPADREDPPLFPTGFSVASPGLLTPAVMGLFLLAASGVLDLLFGFSGSSALNGSGEIDRMILDDATGDAGQYGVLIGMESFGEGLYATYSYEYDLGGTIYNLPASSTGFAVSPGGIRVVGDPANPDRMYSLSEVKATGLSGYTLQAGNRTYQVAEQVVVYEYRDHQYFPSTLDRVQELGLSLTGWYDRPENQGGRIRVIVAR